MSTQNRRIKLALLDPRYFPQIADFRTLFFADVVVILDAIQVHSIWNTNRKYVRDEATETYPINMAVTPNVVLQVPFKSVQKHTWTEVVCQQTGWQSTHVHDLSQSYKGHSHNLGPVMEQIAHFPIRYGDGIRRMWDFLAGYIGETQRKKIIFLSDLQGDVRQFTNRADLTLSLGAKFGATHVLYPAQGWIYRSSKIRKKFVMMRDHMPIPRYANRTHANWSIIDAIVKLGHLGLNDYFTMVATKEGWYAI